MDKTNEIMKNPKNIENVFVALAQRRKRKHNVLYGGFFDQLAEDIQQWVYQEIFKISESGNHLFSDILDQYFDNSIRFTELAEYATELAMMKDGRFEVTDSGVIAWLLED